MIFTIVNSYYYSLKDSPLNSVYSMFVAIWSTLFIIFWKRRQRGLFIEWDNHNNIYQEDDIRKEFEGVTSVNPITDEVEPLFTFKQRIPRYLKSLTICAPYFFAVIVFNIVFLNLTGIIDP